MRFVIIAIWMGISTFVHGQQVDTVSVAQQVDSLIQISRKCILSNDFDNASKIASLAEQLAIEHLGKNSTSYGNVCFIKGKLHYYKGELKETEKCYLEYSSIIKQVSGEDNMDYAWSLDDLGQLYDVMGLFEKAEPLFIKSGLLITKIKGKNHPDYAWSLNDLAIMYRNMGAYEKAEPLYLEAKSIRENALGKSHPDFVWSLNNLANLYNFMGAYEKAEPYYLTSISLWEKLDGKESTNYATGINNLASLYFNMGVFDKAEPLIIESCSLRGKLLGKQSVDYAGSLNNLASLYLKTGEYQKAEPLFIEALTLREKIFGNVHAEVANVIGNLGLLHENMGNYKKAESLFLEAKSIWEHTTGVDHPEYAASVFNLAHFYLKSNQIKQAETLILSALTIREKLLGKEHPDFLESQRLLSKLFVLQGRIHEATTLLEAVSRQQEAELLKATKYLSEYELSQFIDAYQNQEDELCAYNYSCTTNSNSSVHIPLAMIAYDRALFYKGFLLTSAIRLRNLAESTEASKAIYIRLKSYHRRLAFEYALPINERTEVAELEDSANAIEKELVYTVAGYSKNVQQLKWQEVKKALQKNEAAIEFVRFEFNFPKATDSIMYMALLIKENASVPILISMFEEKSLDSLLLSKSGHKADYVNSLYSLSDRGAIAIEAPKKSLYEMLWKPLEKELVGIKTIYFSPSGLLHRINLDAIPVSETETLADKYQLIELGSTRQLVIPIKIKEPNNEAVLFGGIQYELDSSNVYEANLASRSRGTLSFSSVDSTLRGGTWNYLTGTEREVNTIEKIMHRAGVQTKLKKGNKATEESFKNIGINNLPSPRILHIATHGYFFPDDRANSAKSGVAHDSAASERTAKAATPRPRLEFETEEPIFKISEHPMLRSGLIMTGGNVAWQGKQTLEGKEDGILTAFEISQMNLSNTELVVLSACETGLGDIQGNEGVYGLQRAFKIAGAKYLIMSLWQVPDKQTSLLMTMFYKKWLEDKMTIPDAFHAAQKELRDNGLDPYNWAGFVLVE
ncbi:MAG: CHAT domain-containing protein [Saprospiraceae bacterium]|nr:CHAT domain-containing protein [Saprospiraceae bacterium]